MLLNVALYYKCNNTIHYWCNVINFKVHKFINFRLFLFSRFKNTLNLYYKVNKRQRWINMKLEKYDNYHLNPSRPQGIYYFIFPYFPYFLFTNGRLERVQILVYFHLTKKKNSFKSINIHRFSNLFVQLFFK